MDERSVQFQRGTFGGFELKKISRWYDVEFVFDDEEIKDYKFSGFMPRYESIDAILQIMEQAANVTFKMNNKQIVVYTHQE